MPVFCSESQSLDTQMKEIHFLYGKINIETKIRDLSENHLIKLSVFHIAYVAYNDNGANQK